MRFFQAANAMTRAFSTAARFVNVHPRIVLAAWLGLALGVVGLGFLGAVSLFTAPVLPKLFLFAAIAIAAFTFMPRRRR
jgi:hypothetical protein